MKTEIAIDEFVRALGSVIRAVSDDTTRPALNSVYLEVTEGRRFVAVATNGHWLAKFTGLCVAEEFTSPAHTLIELGAARTILSAAKKAAKPKKGAQPLSVVLDLAACTVSIPGVGSLSWPLRDESFPPYAQVIPTDYTNATAADRGLPCWGGSMDYLADIAGSCKDSGFGDYRHESDYSVVVRTGKRVDPNYRKGKGALTLDPVLFECRQLACILMQKRDDAPELECVTASEAAKDSARDAATIKTELTMVKAELAALKKAARGALKVA